MPLRSIAVCHAQVKPGCEQKMVDKLREAAAIYKKDRETIDWIVHQDVKDPTKFAIVERFEQESSQKYRKSKRSSSSRLQC